MGRSSERGSLRSSSSWRASLAGSGSGIVGQLPVRSARGAGVKTDSPPVAGRRGAERLDAGEHVRTLSWPTMPSVFDRMAFAFGGIASIKGNTTHE